jgi:hypothetical protein
MFPEKAVEKNKTLHFYVKMKFSCLFSTMDLTENTQR